jgi:hypothetical protein
MSRILSFVNVVHLKILDKNIPVALFALQAHGGIQVFRQRILIVVTVASLLVLTIILSVAIGPDQYSDVQESARQSNNPPVGGVSIQSGPTVDSDPHLIFSENNNNNLDQDQLREEVVRKVPSQAGTPQQQDRHTAIEQVAAGPKYDTQRSATLAVEATQKQGLQQRSSMAAPKPYDHADFLKDPQAYCELVVPSRIFQTAAGGPNVPRATPISTTDQRVQPRETITLSMQGAPNAPVTFQTHGLGAFGNNRTTQTVASDAEGVASVSWTAIDGTVGDVIVVAASPRAVGNVEFFIHVITPAITLSQASE